MLLYHSYAAWVLTNGFAPSYGRTRNVNFQLNHYFYGFTFVFIQLPFNIPSLRIRVIVFIFLVVNQHQLPE